MWDLRYPGFYTQSLIPDSLAPELLRPVEFTPQQDSVNTMVAPDAEN